MEISMKKRIAKKILKNKDSVQYSSEQIEKAQKVLGEEIITDKQEAESTKN